VGNNANDALQRRKPILSARQVAVTAIFGALAFVFEALRISVPIFLPGITLRFSGVFLTLATLIAGPYSGIIVGFLDVLPTEVGLLGWPGFIIHALVLALLYKRIYLIQNRWARAGVFWVWNSLALLAQTAYWVILYVYVLKLMPLGAMLAFQFVGGFYWVFMFVYNLLPAVLLVAAPNTVKPEWSWTSGR